MEFKCFILQPIRFGLTWLHIIGNTQTDYGELIRTRGNALVHKNLCLRLVLPRNKYYELIRIEDDFLKNRKKSLIVVTMTSDKHRNESLQ